MIFQIRIANKIVQIRSIYELLYIYCKKYVIQDSLEKNPDIDICITEEEIVREFAVFQASVSSNSVNNTNLLEPDYLEISIAFRKIVNAMIPLGRLLMHGSIVSTDGCGYMFTASSGVGKSTRTRLWIENIPGSIVVNGDKPLLEITNDKVIAYGTPWSGKEWWNKNVSVPLRAIMMIERASTAGECAVDELEFNDAYIALLKHIYLPPDPAAKKKTLQMLRDMQGKVHFYRFKSEPTPDAIKLAYEVVRNKVLANHYRVVSSDL